MTCNICTKNVELYEIRLLRKERLGPEEMILCKECFNKTLNGLKSDFEIKVKMI